MTFLPQEIIRKKRDGFELSTEELTFFVDGITDGSISEAQITALTMAVYFRHMSVPECRTLTQLMKDSGDTLDWQGMNLDGPVIDKHSTGGVGDKISLMLAPIIAACGGHVPMISGRGLGHTGGTLDKLESIPGYQTQIDTDRFQQLVAEVGCSIIGQTSQLAPADKRIYAARDISATVDSIPLITASILSKKLAAGLQGLVMDIKCGSGAFAQDFIMAQDLARNLIKVSPIPTTALITDMNQVIGHAAGNALEVQEAIDYLKQPPKDLALNELVVNLAADMLLIGNLAGDSNDAKMQVFHAISSGDAADKLAQMVAAHGGPNDLLERPDKHLPQADLVEPVFVSQTGHIAAIDCRQVGLGIIELGGGRTHSEAQIDPAVGYSQILKVGAEVDPQTPIAMVHANSQEALAQGKKSLRRAFTISPKPQPAISVIMDRL
ncbi:thymidine phosphorylase [Marinicella meishanensis]|uniref:thymidine phosphorylase n=1 Tax=Marinicella meishanensis TaxID=2873263 RepID=UPI001CBBAAD8|nr:thymidine phosphorylase [Marinicella sp. NBU2979]